MKKTYFKLLSSIFIVCLLLSGCGSNNTKEVDNSTTQTQNTTITSKITTITKNTTTTSNNNQIINNTDAKIHFLDTGNSDSIVIEHNGKFAIIDGGENDDEQFVVNYLKKLGAKELDFLEMTHTDADHVGGLDAVANNFNVNKVFVGNGDADTNTYTSFINVLANKQLYPAVPIDEFKLIWDDHTYFQFFNTKTIAKHSNDNSLITLFVHDTDTFLFTGDAGQEQEEKYMNKFPQIDVLKVGHHGSSSSTSETFIKTINPTYAIILVGEGNKYGHPHKETLNTLKNIETYRTDMHGTIIFNSDGNQVKLLSLEKTNKQTTPVTTTKITTTTTKISTTTSNNNLIVTPSGKTISKTYKFKNCDEVRNYFPSGFSKEDYPELYSVNKGRDGDKDGYACEL